MDKELDWLEQQMLKLSELEAQNREQQILNISKLESQNKELVSLVLWSARRLHKSHKMYAYKDLLNIIGEDNPLANYIKGLQNK